LVAEKMGRGLIRLGEKCKDYGWLEFRVKTCFWLTYTPEEGFVLESNHLALRWAPDPRQAERALRDRGATPTQVEKANGQVWTFFRIPFANDREKAATVAAGLVRELYGVAHATLIGVKVEKG
jgi:hypothetical protein